MWMEIGVIPKKDSDKIWKRFRAACDIFFKNKADYFASIDSIQEDNFRLKQELIKKVEKFPWLNSTSFLFSSVILPKFKSTLSSCPKT